MTTAAHTIALTASAVTPAPAILTPPIPSPKDMSRTVRVVPVVTDRNITKSNPIPVTVSWIAVLPVRPPAQTPASPVPPPCTITANPVPTSVPSPAAPAPIPAPMRNAPTATIKQAASLVTTGTKELKPAHHNAQTIIATPATARMK